MSLSTTDGQSAYFPIRVVSSETGVNAITLRAWERRYGLITPKRTAKGHRLYTEDDIQLVKQVVVLLDRGIPISQAKAMIDKGGFDQIPDVSVLDTIPAPSTWNRYRERLIQAINDLNDYQLHLLFNEVTEFFPIDISMKLLFFPQLQAMGGETSSSLSFAQLQFYRAFINARLAVRLSEPSETPAVATLIVGSMSQKISTEQLMLAGLLKSLSIRPVCFDGPLGHSDIASLLTAKAWHGALLTLPADLKPILLQQLQMCTIESGQPIFVPCSQPEQAATLRRHGLIPLSGDLTTDTSMVRDMLIGITI